MFKNNKLKKEIEKLPSEYKVLSDVMLYINNKITITDYIIVSIYGIFVIEAKEYKGKITGDRYGKYWDRIDKKDSYINPINQNNVIIKILSNLLNIEETKFINIVCILNDNKKIDIKNDGEIIDKELVIDKILSYKEKIIDNPDELYMIVSKNNVVNEQIRKKYYKILKNMKDDFGKYVCPRCGNRLIKKNSLLGAYFVCLNYPKCKYKRKED